MTRPRSGEFERVNLDIVEPRIVARLGDTLFRVTKRRGARVDELVCPGPRGYGRETARLSTPLTWMRKDPSRPAQKMTIPPTTICLTLSTFTGFHISLVNPSAILPLVNPNVLALFSINLKLG